MQNSTKTLSQIQEKANIKHFQKGLRNFLLTSRFNNETIEENRKYREKKWKNGCIYNTPQMISKTIPLDSVNFILEMNNDTNRIVGIGCINNRAYYKKFIVYTDDNYNIYTYIGKHRISREEMSEDEEEIMKAFDILCITGKKNIKRGQGIKSFPLEMLYRCNKVINLVNFIQQMFKKRMN